MEPLVLTEGLTKVYCEGSMEVKAVDGVDLQLARGEMIGLFGPSGSGKTTLLSLVGCVLTPTAGSLIIGGKAVVGMDEKNLTETRRSCISFIFQGFNLFPALSALDNVLLGLRVKGITGGEAMERARDTLEAVGLEERMNFLPRDMSGGQRQRVAIARALAADSPLLLADEPTGNLDYHNGRKVMELVRDMSLSKKICVVVATHDNRINDLFDRTIQMEDGKLCKPE